MLPGNCAHGAQTGAMLLSPSTNRPMDGFGPEIAAEIVAACQAGAAEIAATLSRAFDAAIEVTIDEPGNWSPAAAPQGFDGPGLVVVFKLGDAAALAMLPESSGMLPDWYAAPDDSGRDKLGALGQELGTLPLPEQFPPESFNWGRAECLTEAVASGQVAAGAGLLPLTLRIGPDRTAALYLLWPAARPDDVLRGCEQVAPPAAEHDQAADAILDGLADAASIAALPSYARSLLRIAVPLSVTLASKRQSVQSILQLGSGAIIQFEKACDEMLDLSVGDQRVAKGEAVKVGDKFGIRITSFVFPGEQFVPLARDPQRSPQGGRSTVRHSRTPG
jgi:flagellar motor switch/type III secretory pathway protein FliN